MKKEYDIGDYVEIKAIAERSKSYQTKESKFVKQTFGTPKIGRIVGIAKRFEGKINIGSYGGYDGYDDGGNYLMIERSLDFYKVRLGMMNSSLLVFPEDIQLIKPENINSFPLRFTNSLAWNSDDRERLSEDSKDWPRDKKGRWLKQ